MFGHVVKTAGVLSFLLLLALPLAFYEYGYRGVLKEAAFVVAIFALTTCFGHRWLRGARVIDSAPTSLDARLLIGFAYATLFVVIGRVWLFLGRTAGLILSMFQYSVLTGLLGSSLRPPEASAWKFDFWRRREYLPAVLILAFLIVAMFAASWPVLRWWSLVLVPGTLLGGGLAELIGRSVRQWLLALKQVWEVARRMGPPIGAFALGYLVIAFIFAGVFASVWRADSAAFKGLSEHPTPIDFGYYSVVTISTTGYGDVSPQSS
jgi:Ion channel